MTPRSRAAWRSPVLAATTTAMVVASFQAGSLVVGTAPVLASFGAAAASATRAAQLTLLIAGFTFAIAALAPLSGVAADLAGHRSLPLGLLLFAAAMVLFAADPVTGAGGLMWAITTRLAAGAAASLVMTSSTATVLSSYPPDAVAKALSVNQTAWGGGYSAGVLIGGPLCAWNWRAVAAISAILALGSAATAWKALPGPGSPAAARRRPGEVAGGLLHAAGFTLLAAGLLALVDSLGRSAISWPVMGPVLLAIAGTAGLVAAFESHAGGGLRLASFRRGTLASLCASTARSGLPLLVAVTAEAVLLPLHGVAPALAPVEAAVLLAPFGVAQLAFTRASGFLIERGTPPPSAARQLRRVQTMTATAMAVAAVGFVALAVLGPVPPWPALAVVLAILGWASGMFVTPNLVATMRDVEPTLFGRASGIRLAYSYLGVAASSLLFLGLLQTAVGPRLVTATARTLRSCGMNGPASQIAASGIAPHEIADSLAGINPIASLCHNTTDPLVLGQAEAARLLVGPAGSGELRACALATALSIIATVLAWTRPRGAARRRPAGG